MSRALDKDVAASLQSGEKAEALAAFEQISSALAPDGGCSDLLEIEILGRSHPTPPGCHVLRDGSAIAVPKLPLVRAFIVARTRLMTAAPSEAAMAYNDPNVVLPATAVMLLMDPEHLTAANMRKRLLVKRAAAGDVGALEQAVRSEFRLLDSLLTSRLHRHTKSPTLWSHRRWLAWTCVSEWSLPGAVDVHGALQDVVMVSAERHPRNYYAWCHARFLVGLLPLLPDPGKNLTGEQQQDTNVGGIVDAAKQWVFSHHTDTSGWSFLWFLLHGEPNDAMPKVAQRISSQDASSVVAEAAELTVSLRWANESVLVFLRTAAASGLLPLDADGVNGGFISACCRLRHSLAADSPALETVRRAEDWVRAIGNRTPTA